MSPPPPFALLTQDLVFLPSPWAAEVEPYRALFRRLHADPVFCQTAFGDHFKPVQWTDEETRSLLLTRDAALRWGVRGMGDYALGLLPIGQKGQTAFHTTPGRLLQNEKEQVHKVTGEGFETVLRLSDKIRWVGYTCARDATTSGGPITDMYSGGAEAELPPWQEMLEMRYGMDPDFTGRGIATRAAEIVMSWAVEEHGARRFIAATVEGNLKSQKLLVRLGFKRSSTKYFEEYDAIEWARGVA